MVVTAEVETLIEVKAEEVMVDTARAEPGLSGVSSPAHV